MRTPGNCRVERNANGPQFNLPGERRSKATHSISSPSRRHFCFIPIGCQVVPTRVQLLNQQLFLVATPTLQLLLTSNRSVHLVKALPVNEACRIVVVAESLETV